MGCACRLDLGRKLGANYVVFAVVRRGCAAWVKAKERGDGVDAMDWCRVAQLRDARTPTLSERAQILGAGRHVTVISPAPNKTDARASAGYASWLGRGHRAAVVKSILSLHCLLGIPSFDSLPSRGVFHQSPQCCPAHALQSYGPPERSFDAHIPSPHHNTPPPLHA